MKQLLIFIILLVILPSAKGRECSKPQWFTSPENNSEYIVTKAKSSHLSQAIKNAEDRLWQRIYTDDKSELVLNPSDFITPNSMIYTQKQIDRAVSIIYNSSISGVKKERNFELKCDIHYVRIKLKRTAIDDALKDIELVKELTNFILEGKVHLVKKEINWIRYWKRQTRNITETFDNLSLSHNLQKDLVGKKDIFLQQLAGILKDSSQKYQDTYLKIFIARSDAEIIQYKEHYFRNSRLFQQMIKISQTALESNYQETYKMLTILSDHNNPLISSAIGYMWENGIGTHKNPLNAFKWMSLAVRSGSPKNHVRLADYYIDGFGTDKNYRKALKLLKIDELSDDPIVLRKIGLIMLEGGFGVDASPAEGVKMLEKSAKLNDPEAAYLIGQKYYYGEHLAKDDNLAKKWLSISSSSGNTKARSLLKKIENQAISDGK